MCFYNFNSLTTFGASSGFWTKKFFKYSNISSIFVSSPRSCRWLNKASIVFLMLAEMHSSFTKWVNYLQLCIRQIIWSNPFTCNSSPLIWSAKSTYLRAFIRSQIFSVIADLRYWIILGSNNGFKELSSFFTRFEMQDTAAQAFKGLFSFKIAVIRSKSFESIIDFCSWSSRTLFYIFSLSSMLRSGSGVWGLISAVVSSMIYNFFLIFLFLCGRFVCS